MNGTIRERRPGVFELRARTGRDPVSGTYGQISRTVRGTKRDAQKALRALVAEVEAGHHRGGPMTVAGLVEAWLALVEIRLEANTMQGYRSYVRRRIVPGLGHIALRRLTTADLDSFYLALYREEHLAAATVRQIHAILHRALRQGCQWGWIMLNPATNATLPPQRQAEVDPPGSDAVRDLIRLALERDPPLSVFILLAAFTGARRGELCGLRWSDIDAGECTMRIRRSVAVVTGRTYIKDTKTHAERRLALGDFGVAFLGQHHADMAKRATLAGVCLVEGAYVFSGAPDGSTWWHPDQVTRAFGAVRDRAGLPNVRLHDARHFVATALLEAGIAVPTVSGRLGHRNSATTLNIYSHATPAGDRAAADVLGVLLGHRPGGGS